jgi:hypothetical protein
MKIITLIAALTISALIAGPVVVSQTMDDQPVVTTTTTINYQPEENADRLAQERIEYVTTTTISPFASVDWVGLDLLLKEIKKEQDIQKYGKCGQWYDLAISVGWPAEEWSTMSYVLHRESRCNIGSHNKTDPSSGSRGLMQINGYWCRPSKWSEKGWLQDRGILNTCDDLFDPEINLRAGLAIWQYGEEKHGCGWRGPWATPCK